MEEIKLKTKWKKSKQNQDVRNQTQNKMEEIKLKIKSRWKKSNSKQNRRNQIKN